MSEQNDPTGPVNPLVLPFLEFWTGCFQQAHKAADDLLAGLQSNPDPEVWRKQWLDSATKSMDAYLRSPFFLQLLKAHTDTLVETKRQENERTEAVADEAKISEASKASELLERMDRFEESLLKRLKRIEERLEAIEENLGNSIDAE